jgi:hypothetical protein
VDANDLLMGGGAPSAKFPVVGTTVVGTITEQPEVQQVRDFSTGEPQFWNDGKPKQQIVVTLGTQERDPQINDDDGTRRIFVKGGMVKAVREAVKRSGAKGLEVGGRLEVTYTGDGERKGNLNAPKLYSASYTPAPAATADDVLNGDQGAAAPPPPAQPNGAPTDFSQMTPEQIQALLQAAQAQQQA